MRSVEEAKRLSENAHNGQVQKYSGYSMIQHCQNVVNRCTTNDQRCVAWMHDVVEDTDLTVEDIRDSGFDEDIVQAVDDIARKQDETYREYITRVAKLPLENLARQVKIFDLQDHLCDEHIGQIPDSLVKRYKKSLIMFSEYSWVVEEM